MADPGDTTTTFQSTFTTTGTGRFPFAFTSFGDLGTPGAGATYTLADGSTVTSTTYSESQWNAYTAVGEVEALAAAPPVTGLPPLFHLLNGDLCYADKATITSTGGTHHGGRGPARPRGLAGLRPQHPALGGQPAVDALHRQPRGRAGQRPLRLPLLQHPVRCCPTTACPASPATSTRSGWARSCSSASTPTTSATREAGPTTSAAWPPRTRGEIPSRPPPTQYNQFYTGTFTANGDGTLSPGGATPNAQTTWLQQTLSTARADTTIDWIIVQMHQCALSSTTDNGCDAGIRQAWLPLFDEYQVDLVVNGHDHDYERSYPVRGFVANQGTSTFARWHRHRRQRHPHPPFHQGQPGQHLHPQGGERRHHQPVQHLRGDRVPDPRGRRHQQAGQRLRRRRGRGDHPSPRSAPDPPSRAPTPPSRPTGRPRPIPPTPTASPTSPSTPARTPAIPPPSP